MRNLLNGGKVAIALSGGVDSAVAALLLVEQGFDLIGVTLRLRGGPEERPVPSPEAIRGARSVTRQLGIPFRLIDAQDAFEREVVDYFIAEYGAGRTPNPCVRCNRFIRFSLLVDRAVALGATALATGHYARIQELDGTHQLLGGCDPEKDQSYFLHALTQEQLAYARFPLGELTKEHVRHIASEHRLAIAQQAESQDVCFLAGDDYREFLSEQAPELFEPGPIQDSTGQLLGQHEGLAAYTIGQRKGLNISGAEPLYVLALKPRENTLVVGPADELGRNCCRVENIHYISGRVPCRPFRAEAQIRYRAQPAPVTVHPLPRGQAEVRFDTRQRDITPGQFLVLYEAEVVLGGAVIC